MSFTTRTQVRFAHVDAAGIVFYPRYFEMLNSAVEDWFAQAVGVDFATMHMGRRVGVPTVRIECDFVSPSKLGDELDINVTPTRIGKSSCDVAYEVSCGGEIRLRARGVLVCMDLDAQRSVPWPDDMRGGIEKGLVAPAA